jgi:16S rRNA (cytosine967-C5)-methyltransferase
MISPARRAAYRVLLAVERGRGDLPQALARARAQTPDHRDQALAAQIAIGTLRWRGALDYLIEHFARRRLVAFDPEVLTVLRLGAYQLVHLTRVPASAAVHDSVELAREARKTSATGLVNAVLRAVAAARERLPFPAAPGRGAPAETHEATVDRLSITQSHPRWLVARWLARYGQAATEDWLRINNQEAPLTLRANLSRISAVELASRLSRHGVATRPARWAPHGLIVTSGNPLRTPLEAEGLFVVQDEASQLVGLVLPLRTGARVLDACASPGGKTTAIAARMDDGGLLVASDVRAKRVDLLRETVERCGARGVRIVQADLAVGPPFSPVFDAVLLDAPCSGLGTLRRDPDIKWRRREEDVHALATGERRMLEQASSIVAPGGCLVYATCSSEPEENERVVEQFLASHQDFAAARADGPGSGPGLPAAVLDKAGHLRTLPHVHGLEAFFAALLVRRPPAL